MGFSPKETCHLRKSTQCSPTVYEDPLVFWGDVVNRVTRPLAEYTLT